MNNSSITKIIEMEKEFYRKFPFAIIDWKLGKENDGDGISKDKMSEIKSHIKETLLSLSQLAIERLEWQKHEVMREEFNPSVIDSVLSALNQEIEHHREIIKFLEQR